MIWTCMTLAYLHADVAEIITTIVTNFKNKVYLKLWHE